MTCDSGGGGFVCRCEGCGELPVGPCRGVEDGEEEAEEDVVVVMDEALLKGVEVAEKRMHSPTYFLSDPAERFFFRLWVGVVSTIASSYQCRLL